MTSNQGSEIPVTLSPEAGYVAFRHGHFVGVMSATEAQAVGEALLRSARRAADFAQLPETPWLPFPTIRAWESREPVQSRQS